MKIVFRVGNGLPIRALFHLRNGGFVVTFNYLEIGNQHALTKMDLN